MRKYFLGDRAVSVDDVDFQFEEGAYVRAATFEDDNSPLSDEQMAEVEATYQQELYEDAYSHMASRAYDDAKDRWKYGE